MLSIEVEVAGTVCGCGLFNILSQLIICLL